MAQKVKESACNVRDLGSISGSGRSPGGGRDNPHQYSCLGNSMDRGAWWATVNGVTKSDMTEQLILSLFHTYDVILPISLVNSAKFVMSMRKTKKVCVCH